MSRVHRKVPDMTPTDIAAWVGALAGIAALIWQVATRRRSAHRVKVSTAIAVTDAGRSSGDPEVYVTVEARNLGASSVDISNWGIRLAGGENAWVRNPIPISATLPLRLEAGARVSFYFPEPSLRDIHRRTGLPYARMRPWVQLATGQTIRASRHVPLK